MSVFFILLTKSRCDWKSPIITLFTACEADQSIIGDGTCDAEAATWECDEYDGGDCIGNVNWFYGILMNYILWEIPFFLIFALHHILLWIEKYFVKIAFRQ